MVIQKVNQDLGVQIRVHSFTFTLPTTLTLHHVQIPDQHEDTLFFIEKITLPLVQFNRKQHVISIGHTQIEGAFIHMGYRGSDSLSNYAYLIRYLSPDRDPNAPKAPTWHIRFKTVEFKNSEFRYFNDQAEPAEVGLFNPSDMRFSQINGTLSPLHIVGDSLSMVCKELSTRESSGIEVLHLASSMRISSTTMQFNKLKLQTPQSTIGDYLKFSYQSWSDFSDFNRLVNWDADIHNSHFNMADLKPFTHKLGSLEDLKLRLELELHGTTDRLKVRNAWIRTHQQTELKGNFHFYGLPQIENSYFNLDIQQLKTEGTELTQIMGIEPIEMLRSAGPIDYSGSFKGFYNNFVSYGTLITDQGKVKTDMSLDMSGGIEKAIYSGTIKTENLDMGALLQNPSLGKVSMEFEIKEGLGLSTEHFSFKIQGAIPHIRLDQYTYKNTQIDGHLTDHYFKGKATVKDEHIAFDFDGLIDLREGNEEADFNLHLKKLHLNQLGYDTLPGNITGQLVINTQGRQLDLITGSLETRDFKVERGPHLVDLSELKLISEFRTGSRFFELNSHPVDLTLQGNFSLQGLPTTLSYIGGELLPGILPGTQKLDKVENLSFSINCKDITPIIRLFDEQITLGKGQITGELNSEFLSLNLRSQIDHIHINGLEILNAKLNAQKKKNEDLNLQYMSSIEFSNSKFKADTVNLTARFKANQLYFNLNASDLNEVIQMGVDGDLQFGDSQGVQLHLAKMQLNLKGKPWLMSQPTSWHLLPELSSDSMELISGQEEVLFTSQFNPDIQSTEFGIRLKQFDLSHINAFLPPETPLISGIAEGSMGIKPSANNLGIFSNMFIYSMAIEQDTLGDLRLVTEKKEAYKTHVSATIKTGIFNGLNLSGLIGDPSDPQQLDLVLQFPKTEVSIFSQFLSGISGLKGKASGNIQINGTLSDPLLNGGLELSQVALSIDYLRVPFTINASVKVASNQIKIGRESRITDDKNKVASIEGWLKHNQFKDWQYHISIADMRDFHVLNTNKSDNDLFYGQAYVDGSGTFFGSFEKFNMKLKARTKSGTLIKMPVGESEASGPAPYIRFKTEKTDIEEQQVDIGFLNSLLMEIEITPATEVQLIFDEQTGDIIKGSGSGRLVMEVNEDGNFTMRGGLTVERGDYQFVAFNNLVNKRFFIERGGTIMWDGDPLQARIDLTTYNLQMASPNPLLGRSASSTAGTSGGQVLSTVQARSEIHLRGSLFRPEISFGFDIQNLLETGMSELTGVVQRVQNDPDEVNRQVFSLLVFGSFVVPSFISVQDVGDMGQGAPLSTGLADLVTNQVDAWLSQIDPKWLVDFNLTSTTPDQRSDMIFRLGRKFANDRIIVDIIYGTNQAGPANNSFNMEYLATRDGRFRLKAFSRTAAIYNNANAIAPVNTIGIGVFYRKEFNRFFPNSDSHYIENPIDTNALNLNLQDSIPKQDSTLFDEQVLLEPLDSLWNANPKQDSSESAGNYGIFYSLLWFYRRGKDSAHAPPNTSIS